MSRVEVRTAELYARHIEEARRGADGLFALLMPLQWLGAVAAALVLSPSTWAGPESAIHPHVIAALAMGGLLTIFPILLIKRAPGRMTTRLVTACAQVAMSALLIHIAGGRIEAHFHVFGSLALLAFYQDWRMLACATGVVAADHIVRGAFMPLDVYGTAYGAKWRWVEHSGWVAFEVSFLLLGIRRRLSDLRQLAGRQAELESLHAGVERAVAERTTELEQSEEQLRQIVDNISEIFWMTSGDGTRTLYVSPAFEKIYGRPCSDVYRSPMAWQNSVHPDDLRRSVQAYYDSYATGMDTEQRIIRPDGQVRWIRARTFPVKDASGNVYRVAGVAADITEQKTAQMELARGRERLYHSQKMEAVGQLAAGVAHEINNPLGVILGFAQGLASEVPEDSELSFPLKSIEREAVRCRNLVQDLLTFSRAGKADRHPADINAVVGGALSLINAQARVRRVDIDFRPGDLPKVMANVSQLQQVVVNLASNAFDAMPSGGKLTLRTRLAQEGALSWACLEIEDTGSGIPAEALPRVFEPFFTTKEPGKGTGLGLSLVHEIVKKHSGSVSVESRPGRTVFTIRLPVKGPEEGR